MTARRNASTKRATLRTGGQRRPGWGLFCALAGGDGRSRLLRRGEMPGRQSGWNVL